MLVILCGTVLLGVRRNHVVANISISCMYIRQFFYQTSEIIQVLTGVQTFVAIKLMNQSWTISS